jgi:hypothetical protein
MVRTCQLQQQHFDQGSGAGGVAVDPADGFPPSVVHRRELARRPRGTPSGT